jgi:arginine/lysine/ornithine decarboxylase
LQVVLSKSEDAKSKVNGLVESFCSSIDSPDLNLEERMKAHMLRESVSFHTPGHKGRSQTTESFSSKFKKYDLTELPGLDDLSNPSTVFVQLEKRVADLWRSSGALLSVNGASAALIAALMGVAKRGQSILLPRNAHRAVINGLVLSGLKPVWYEPDWDETWGLWGAVSATSLSNQIESHKKEGLAAVLLVSPTYSGCLSEIKKIAHLVHSFDLPLIVDEAHGAYLLDGQNGLPNAIDSDADLVVHSLHKNLGACTQTGVLHIGRSAGERFGLEKEALRGFLSLVQSTSPNYLLLASISELVEELNSKTGIENLQSAQHLGDCAKKTLREDKRFAVYQPPLASPLHVLIRANDQSPSSLETTLAQSGIFAETSLGNGVLLMLGIGSDESDIASLLHCLEGCSGNSEINSTAFKFDRPPAICQVMSPREAFLASNRLVPSHQAEGLVAAQCIALCPPGWPVVVPGQKLGKNEIENAKVEYLRVVTPDN